MKSGLYLKLSVNGIKKNKKLYLPYLITCICMVMMFYLIDYLAVSPQFAQIKGGGYYADDPWIWFRCDRNLFADPSVLHEFISDPQTTERVWVVSHPWNGKN